jgi:hypothetical protein
MMRRLTAALLTWFALSVGPAAAATSPATAQGNSENGKIVVFGCPSTVYATRSGSGAATHFAPGNLGSAARSQVFITGPTPLSADPSTATVYRGVLVTQGYSVRAGWLPERCFHLPVFAATVTCDSPMFVDNGSPGNEVLIPSENSVHTGDVVYPTGALSANRDHEWANARWPGHVGFVPRRCLAEGHSALKPQR